MTKAAAPSDRPVFVDPSGRRRLLLRVAIGVVVAAVVGYLVLLAVALGGGPIKPSTLLPVPQVDQPTLVPTTTPTTTADANSPATSENSAATTTTTTAPSVTTTTTTEQNGRRTDPPGASNRPTKTK